MRLLAILLLALSASAGAFVGEFPVCDKKPQYVRLEIYDGFPPFQCPSIAAERGNPLPMLLLAIGTFYASCAMYAPGTERATLVVSLKSPDEIIGHELRHAFPPHEFHPPMLPFLTLGCD